MLYIMYMKKSFVVDEVTYVVEVIDNEVFFYIEENNSKITETTKSNFPVTVIRNVMSLVEGYVSTSSPVYFRYSSNSVDKISLYIRLSDNLCKKYPYYCRVVGNTFIFNRLF